MVLNFSVWDGHWIVFTGEGGSEEQRRMAEKVSLRVGQKYEIEHVDVHCSHTNVTLKEYPSVVFDLKMFVDAPESKAPKPVENPDFSVVIESCKDHLRDIEKDEPDEDSDHYIYEVVMEAVFGKEVWDYINEKT